jgi:competence protein ComEC
MKGAPVTGAETGTAQSEQSSASSLVAAFLGRPLLPAAVAFALGIGSFGSAWAFPVGILAAGTGLVFGRRTLPPALLAAAALFFFLGWAHQGVSTGAPPADISHLIGKGYLTVRGSVAGDPEPSRFTTSFLFRVSEVEHPDGAARSHTGLAVARIPNDAGPLDYGDAIQLRGALQEPGGPENPGLFRYPEYLARMGVYSSLIIRRPSGVTRIPGAATLVDRMAGRMQAARRSLLASLDRLLPPDHASLLSGIVLGQRTRLPAELKDDFAATGTTHILASSGMNVGILAAAVFGLSKWARIRRSRGVWVVIPALLLYTLLAGAKPSIVRADVMATVFLLAHAMDREPDLPSAMALAALILLVWQPAFLYDPGFQLSFVVVAALVAVMPALEAYVRYARPAAVGRSAGALAAQAARVTGAAFIMSIVAQFAALPLTAQHFNQISLVGMLANALILAWIPVLFVGGFVLWGMSALSVTAAGVVAIPIGAALAFVIGVARGFGASPLAVVNIPSPGWACVAAYYLLLGWALWRWRARVHSRSVSAS